MQCLISHKLILEKKSDGLSMGSMCEKKKRNTSSERNCVCEMNEIFFKSTKKVFDTHFQSTEQRRPCCQPVKQVTVYREPVCFGLRTAQKHDI